MSDEITQRPRIVLRAYLGGAISSRTTWIFAKTEKCDQPVLEKWGGDSAGVVGVPDGFALYHLSQLRRWG